MIAIAMKNIEKYYGAAKVLYDITMEINEGEKTALIGSNGCGKTTLFKIIAGIEKHDNGMLALRKGIKIGYLEQMGGCYPDQTVVEVLTSGLEELVELKAEMERLEAMMSMEADSETLDSLVKKYGRLMERYESLDGYNMENRVNMIAEGLQISTELFGRAYEQLSGGEKTRILFARMLISQPELLLLDEPTNHLDIHAVEWLEGFIKDYSGTVLIISHDRYFLDKAVNRIIEMEEGKCENYNGNYSYFVQEKERRLLVEFENYQDQQKKIKHMEEAIKRLRDWGARGDNEKFFRKAASMQKALDRMEKIKRPILERRRVELDFESADRSGKEVVVCSKLQKAYGEKVLFSEADFSIKYKEKVGIIGANGTGKSTLLKMILGMELPDGGELKVGSNVKIGYLEQSIQMEDESLSILEEFKGRFGITEGEARGILARFLFYKDSVHKKLRDLSGGEKTRLRLAELMYDDVNFLILDEPTNHLDIDTREALEETLENYEGTILFISHDRYFINKLTERLCNIEGGKLVNYCGDYDYFKEKYAEPQREIEIKKEEKQAKPLIIRMPAKVNKDTLLSEVEKDIERVEADIAQIKEMMEDSNYTSDYVLLQELNNKLQAQEDILEKLYEKWDDLSG